MAAVPQLRELQLTYRSADIMLDRPTLRTPRDAAHIVALLLEREPMEVFGALMLDTRHGVLCWKEISRGSLAASVVLPRDVFFAAIHANAAGIVLAHNHPSGDTIASAEDMALTTRLVAAGELLGIVVVDHIIVGAGRQFSFKEGGLL